MKKTSLPVILILTLALIVGVASAYGNITVSSVPTGATILLNGTSTGLTTPATLENIPAGTHTILLRLTGYLDINQSVTVSENATSPVSLTMVAATSTPIITSISPTSATNGGWQTIDIVGTGFSGSTVTLTKSEQSTITGALTSTSDTTTSLSRNFNLNGVAVGSWNLFILNSDGGNVTGSFTVNNATAATVTSISPTSGVVNTTVAATIAGTGFSTTAAKIRLYRSGNYIGGTVNSGGSTTQLTGSFNLNQATPGSYDVCVLPDGTETGKICGPTFTILATASAANGTIYFASTPSGAVVYVDSVQKGNTPFTLYNVTPGSYAIRIQRATYLEWADRVTVTATNQTTVSAKLTAVDSSTTVTTAPPIVVSTATPPPTTIKSTKTVPTPWKDTATTAASPVEITVIIGALAAGALVLRRK